jgi:hypothetical protein
MITTLMGWDVVDEKPDLSERETRSWTQSLLFLVPKRNWTGGVSDYYSARSTTSSTAVTIVTITAILGVLG